jgi:exopolysaccharide biosynthesis polyprenyl glycosylphosphotransferase
MEKNIQPLPRIRLQASEQRFLLMLIDLLVGYLALFIALHLWALSDGDLVFSSRFLAERVPGWFYLLPIFWLLLLSDLYDLNKASDLETTLKGIGVATLLAAFLYLLVYFTLPRAIEAPRLGVALFIILVSILTLVWRLIHIKLFSSINEQRRVIIVGAGKAGTTLVAEIAAKKVRPFNLLGLIDDDPAKQGTKVNGYPILGNYTCLNDLIADLEVTDLILAISNKMNHGMFQSILIAQEAGINLTTMSAAYEQLTRRVPISLLESDWVIRSFLDKAPTGAFYRLVKRALDLLGGLGGTMILALLYPLIALIIRLDSKGPIIYKQERLGLGGRPYQIYKFRTMKDNKDMVREGLVTSANDPRVTRVGKFLRRSHIDELPQMINVLKGEMSLVGPRSERTELVTVFQNIVPFYRARMLTKPGITGWAQVNQAYAETVDETAIKLEYDLYYIQHANLLMDFDILLRTFGAVLGFRGR